MDKVAAEKIASDYFNAGVQLALANAGITKTANKKTLLSFLGGAGLGAGASAVPAAMSRYEAMLASRAADRVVNQALGKIDSGRAAAADYITSLADKGTSAALSNLGTSPGALSDMATRGAEGVRSALSTLGALQHQAAMQSGRFGDASIRRALQNLPTTNPAAYAVQNPSPVTEDIIRGLQNRMNVPSINPANYGGIAHPNMRFLDSLIAKNPPPSELQLVVNRTLSNLDRGAASMGERASELIDAGVTKLTNNPVGALIGQ